MPQLWQGKWTDDTGNVRRVRRTHTFSAAANLGAQGAVPLFTITGQVLVKTIAGFVTTNCVGASGTLALGVTGSTSLFIAATAVAQLVTTTPNWITTTATAGGGALIAACKDVLIGADIIATVATTDFSSGVIVFSVTYIPFSDDGKLVPVS